MATLGLDYEKGAVERAKIDSKLLKEAHVLRNNNNNNNNNNSINTNKGTKTQREFTTQNIDDGDTSFTKFAKFMAKGVKKTLKKVVTNIGDLIDDTGGSELIFPLDPRPLCVEENQCIKLMQSFCPRQSTPDSLVGTTLAQGFSRCIHDRAPPVLTRNGVVPGDKGRLPNNGIEAFVDEKVIRAVVYQNCEEYHDVIAHCRKLSLYDLSEKLSKDVINESKLIRLIKWWVKFSKIQANAFTIQGADIKDNVRFFLGENNNQEDDDDTLPIYHLKDFLFYLDKDKIRSGNEYSIEDLPMPESIIPKRIHNEVTTRVLSDPSLNAWFSPLPVEIWIDFISQHSCMASGLPAYDQIRLQVLSTLGNEFRRVSSVLMTMHPIQIFKFTDEVDLKCIFIFQFLIFCNFNSASNIINATHTIIIYF